MNLKLRTSVSNHFLNVKELFDEKLFMKLSPPFPLLRLQRFDGCEKGDKVAIQLNFLLFKQEWHSLIVSSETTTDEFVFVDEGTKLPFMFCSWRHRHVIRRLGDNETEIIDEIYFSSHNILLDYLLLPAMYLQFAYRKPIYKRILRREQIPATIEPG